MKKIVFISCLINCIISSAFSQNHLAVIKPQYEQVIISSGENAIDTLNRADTFLVYIESYEYALSDDESSSMQVWTKDGQNGYVDKSKVNINGAGFFKLDYTKNEIIELACHDYTKHKFNNIYPHFCNLIKQIVDDRSFKALKEFFVLNDSLVAAPASIHSTLSWTILNNFSDGEFYNFLKQVNEARQKGIAQYLKQPYVTFPISNYSSYYSTYYPKCWEIMKKYE